MCYQREINSAADLTANNQYKFACWGELQKKNSLSLALDHTQKLPPLHNASRVMAPETAKRYSSDEAIEAPYLARTEMLLVLYSSELW